MKSKALHPRKKIGGKANFFVNLPDGAARPMTADEITAFSASFFLVMAEPKLRTYPSLKQLRLQQEMLDQRWACILDGIGAIDGQDSALRKQLGRTLSQIDRARDQLFDLEMERMRLERLIDWVKEIRAESVQAATEIQKDPV